MGDAPTGPLAGIRVLELAANFTGPIATMWLGDQGADVIKVEPATGDQLRYVGACRDGVARLSSVFLSANRNKRSVGLDLKDPESVAALKNVIARSDVFLQNYRPGVIESLGLGYDEVVKIRPDIIYISINGLGTTGPESRRKVYDTVVQGMAGPAYVQRDPHSGVPRVVQNAIADKVTALFVFQAVTAALLARAHTGKGQFVSVSMLDAMISFMWPDSMSNDTLTGASVRPSGTAVESNLVYQTKDGYILATAMSNSDWRGLVTALGRPELAKDPRFLEISDRVRNTHLIHGELQPAFLLRTTSEWLPLLRDADAVFAPINATSDLHLDEQVRALGSIIEVEHPTAGAYRQPVHPARFASTPATLWRHAPQLGEHNEEVLGASAAGR